MAKIGPDKKISNLEKSLGKWVKLTIIGNGSAYGKISNVEGRNVTFNPHKSYRYNEANACNLFLMLDEDAYLEISPNGYFIEPTTLETLNYEIEKNNQEILKEIEKAKEIERLRKSKSKE